MSTRCHHGRKKWSCHMCKVEIAQDYTEIEKRIAASIDPKDLKDRYGIDLSEIVKAGTTSLPSFSEVPEKPLIDRCPIPSHLIDDGAKDLDYVNHKTIDHNCQPAFQVYFERGTRCYIQIVPCRDVEKKSCERQYEYNFDPHQASRDSDYVLDLISKHLNKRVLLAKGAQIIDAFLDRRYRSERRPCKLDGTPRVHRRQRQIVYPTTRGLKTIPEEVLIRWLHHQYKPSTTIVNTVNTGFISSSMAAESLGKAMEKIMGIARHDVRKGEMPTVDAMPRKAVDVSPANISVSFSEGALDRVNINGPCEIIFNGKKFKAVREGDKLLLITEDFRKLI